MGDIPQVFAAFALMLVLLEVTWSRITARRVYNVRESLSNFSMALVNTALKPLTLAWTAAADRLGISCHFRDRGPRLLLVSPVEP
jgi:hypothetical protein